MKGAKKCNLSCSATLPLCDASMQKEKEKVGREENEVSLFVTD
jgi:hypothetical protein